MKRSIASLLAVLLSVGLPACGDDQAPNNSSGGTSGTSGTASGGNAAIAGNSTAGQATAGSADGAGSSTGGSGGGGEPGSAGRGESGAGPITPPGSEPSPMPVISQDVPAFASSTASGSNPDYAKDGKPSPSWSSASVPAWLAYDLSGVPSEKRKQVLVAWYDGASVAFINPTVDASLHWPIDYTLEINTAAGGGDPPADGWKVVATVTGNDRNTRQRLVDFEGANWVRMNVSKSSSPDTVGLDLDVHSAPDGASDSWLFMGDSITFLSTTYLFSDLPALVHAEAPERWPAVIPAAIGGTNTVTALDAIDETIEDYPGRFVVLAYGTNDHADDYHMEELVQAVIAAGKIPVVPHMPWSSATNIQDSGPKINAIIDALYEKYPQIVHGPDFWTIFENRSDLIPTGDVHPNDLGQKEFRKQWALAMTQ
jgi:hypothetical protein